MSQKIDVYKSVVEMDSKPYVDGAKAGEKAAKDLVKADEEVETQTKKRKIVNRDPSFAQYERRLLAFDRLAKAQKVYADQEAFVSKAMAAGVINQQQGSALLDAVATKYEKLGLKVRGSGTELENSAKKIALNRFQLMTLQYTLNDVAASLASGINPFTILMQQGGQVTQAFGGIRGTISTFVQAVGVARLSLIGLGAAFALSIAGAEKQNRFYGEMERRLKGLGDQANLSKEQIKSLVAYADRMPSVSTKDAKTAVSDLVTTAHVSKTMYTDLIALAEKYSLVTGTDLPTAMHTLATGFKNTSGFARELQSNVKGFEDFSYAVYAKIKAMEESGRQDEAQRQLLAEMQKTLADVDTRGVTPLMRATEDLADAWATLKGAITPALNVLGESGSKILAHMANNVTKLTIGLRFLHETFQSLARMKMPDQSQTKEEAVKKLDNKNEKSLPGPGALERQARLAADAERERSREAKALIQSLAQENQTRMKGLALLERQKRETLEQAQALMSGGEREVAVTKAKEEALRIMDEYHIRDEAFRQREIADWERLAAMKYDNEQREKERVKILEEQKQISTQLSERLSSGITSAFREGTSAGQVFKNMMLDMLEEIAKKQFLMPLFSSILGGGGPASFLTSFFGGGHAQGGTVSPNHYYTVGENGPETFVPSKSGSIIPSQSSGSKTINFNVNVAANSPAAKDRQSAESAGRAIALAARAELQDFLASEKRFGGSLYGVGA